MKEREPAGKSVGRSSAAVIEFLRCTLGGGARLVNELESKARELGFLTNEQPLKTSKPFKKAKRLLGIRSVRTGYGPQGKWSWELPESTVSGEIGSEEPARETTPLPQDQTRVSEVASTPAMASSADRIPLEWLTGIGQLQYNRAPVDVPHHQWQVFLNDCHRFKEDWAERAASLGWDAPSLFGCHRLRPLEQIATAGLLWLVRGDRIVELHRDWAVFERAYDKAKRVYHRRQRMDPTAITLPWLGQHQREGGLGKEAS